MSEKFTMTPTGHEGAHKLEHEFVPNARKQKKSISGLTMSALPIEASLGRRRPERGSQ